MKTIIRNAEILNPYQHGGMADVVIEQGIITGVYENSKDGLSDDLIIDADGRYLCPGFIDVHFHGALGMDTMDADSVSFNGLSRYCAQHGVTSFYPTTWAAPHEAIMKVLTVVESLPEQLPGAQIPGIHLEGPYLSNAFSGAQDIKMMAMPQEEEYQTWFETGVVKLVTCAPELPGASELIQAAIRRGICVSIGHSGATFDEVQRASDLGATQATHLFNGMRGLHHREPGTVGGILDDHRLFAQIICDGVHLHPAIIRLAQVIKSSQRTILITDSIIGAGLGDGVFENNGNEIIITDGIARTKTGGLAGSTLSMDRAISNMMAFTGLPLESVLPMATSTPAEAMGIADWKGRIAPGFDADLVIMDKDLKIERTFVGGKLIYTRI